MLAALAMAPEWQGGALAEPTPIRGILGDTTARPASALALVNATPLAVSSTLFLFFVESRAWAPGWEGPLLVLFFLAAAASAPGWGWAAAAVRREATRFSARWCWRSSAFLFVLTLGEGDVLAFAVICVLSGATIGADLTLMPALFARRMATISPNGGQGFGLWSLVTKLSLAFAAVALLPLLEASGFGRAPPTTRRGPAHAHLSLRAGALPPETDLAIALLLVATP
jgi:glycoside/pentoside/hexuronide:cation symporter, GPH family